MWRRRGARLQARYTTRHPRRSAQATPNCAKRPNIRPVIASFTLSETSLNQLLAPLSLSQRLSFATVSATTKATGSGPERWRRWRSRHLRVSLRAHSESSLRCSPLFLRPYQATALHEHQEQPEGGGRQRQRCGGGGSGTDDECQWGRGRGLRISAVRVERLLRPLLQMPRAHRGRGQRVHGDGQDVPRGVLHVHALSLPPPRQAVLRPRWEALLPGRLPRDAGEVLQVPRTYPRSDTEGHRKAIPPAVFYVRCV